MVTMATKKREKKVKPKLIIIDETTTIPDPTDSVIALTAKITIPAIPKIKKKSINRELTRQLNYRASELWID